MTIRQSTAAFLWLLPILATALMLSSCSHPAARSTQASATPAPVSQAAQIAQMGYGTQADFMHCVPPQCPVRTPKTLGAAPTPEAPSATTPQSAPAAAPATPLQPEPEANNAPDTPTAAEQLIWSVPFAFGSAQLGAKAHAVMRQVTDELPPSSRITIAGRTDSSGPAAVNDALAHARAQAVRGHLLRTRPELAPAITLDAQGSCCFTASNEIATGRARNRRVEILAEPAAPPP